MKKVLALILVVVLAAAAFAGCSAPAAQESASAQPSEAATTEATDSTESAAPAAADGDLTIGIALMDYNYTFFQDMLAAAKMEAEAQGVKLVDVDGGNDVQKQLEGVEDMITGSHINALILNPVDSAAIGAATLQANEAGIPVVTVDIRSEEGEVVAHVASDNKDIGKQSAEMAVETLKEKNGSEKGTILVVGMDQITSVRDRTEGFMEYMEQYPDIEIIKQDPVNYVVEGSQELVTNLLQTYPKGELDIIFGGNATNAMGALAAVEAAGRTDVLIQGVDDDPVELEAIEKGDIFLSTIVQSPTDMGKLGVQIAVAAAKGEEIKEKEVATELTLVNKDNIAEFYESYNANQAALEPYKS